MPSAHLPPHGWELRDIKAVYSVSVLRTTNYCSRYICLNAQALTTTSTPGKYLGTYLIRLYPPTAPPSLYRKPRLRCRPEKSFKKRPPVNLSPFFSPFISLFLSILPLLISHSNHKPKSSLERRKPAQSPSRSITKNHSQHNLGGRFSRSPLSRLGEIYHILDLRDQDQSATG